MEKAIISLSFDDGRGDNLEIFQNILIPMSIPATINITTGYVDGTCPVHLSPSPKRAVAKSDVIALAQNPLVEVAMHGDCHLNTVEDIAAGRKKLIAWLDLEENSALGFASPGSGLKPEEFIKSNDELFAHQITYMRTSLRIKSFHEIRVLCRKIGRIFHIPFLYRIAYADTLMRDCEDRVIYSIPVMKDTTFAQLKAVIDLAINRRCALTLMFHSILEDTECEDNWSWKQQAFEKLCAYLKKKTNEGQLSVMTTGELYGTLRG